MTSVKDDANHDASTANTLLNHQPLVQDPMVLETYDDATQVETPLAVPITGDHFDRIRTNSLDSFDINGEDWEHPGHVGTNTTSVSSKLLLFIMKTRQFYHYVILPNVGLALLLLSQFLNSIMVTTCKLLVTDKDFNVPIHPLQILFIRMFVTYICCLIYMGVTRSVEDAPFGPPRVRKLLVMRGLVGFFGVFGMYFSLQYLSLSDAVAITFLVPMFTAFLAFVILKESYSILEGVCSFLSLGGVLLIAKPSFLFGDEPAKENDGDETVESASSGKRILATVVGLIGVCGASCVYIVLRKIGMHAHPLLSVSYFALTCCVVTFASILVIPSLSFVLPSNGYQWFLFSVIGISGFFMQFSLTAGVQRVKASRASLMAYTGMVFAIIWDLTIWHHLPGILSFLGIALIIGNAVIILKFKPEHKEETNADAKDSDMERNGAYDKIGNDPIAMQDFIITDDDDDDDDENENDDDVSDEDATSALNKEPKRH